MIETRRLKNVIPFKIPVKKHPKPGKFGPKVRFFLLLCELLQLD